jgi:hypothetical protein
MASSFDSEKHVAALGSQISEKHGGEFCGDYHPHSTSRQASCEETATTACNHLGLINEGLLSRTAA